MLRLVLVLVLPVLSSPFQLHRLPHSRPLPLHRCWSSVPSRSTEDVRVAEANRKWGGGIMGVKSQAKTAKKMKIINAEIKAREKL